MISGAVREEGRARGEAAPIGEGGDLGQRATFSSKENDLRIAGAPRRQNRPLDEAEPQNHGVAIWAPRNLRIRRGDGSGKKNQNRRFGHGGSGIHDIGIIGEP